MDKPHIHSCEGSPDAGECLCTGLIRRWLLGDKYTVNLERRYLISQITTCIKTAECKAYPQLCENEAAVCVDTELGPECRCRRTFYLNQKHSTGMCLVGSDIYEVTIVIMEDYTQLVDNGSIIPLTVCYDLLFHPFADSVLQYRLKHQVEQEWISQPMTEMYPTSFTKSTFYKLIPVGNKLTNMVTTITFDYWKKPDMVPDVIRIARKLGDTLRERICDQHLRLNSSCYMDYEPDSIGILHPEIYDSDDGTASDYQNLTVVYINSCLSPDDHDCHDIATYCKPTPERDDYAFTCECKKGYKLVDSEEYRSHCIDINECETLIEPCHPREIANCRNTIGGYECDCPSGYAKRESVSKDTCMPFNKCVANPNDPANCGDPKTNKCIPDDLAGFTCACQSGYARNAKGVCLDIDECATIPNNCSLQFAVCTNTEGSFKCRCYEGFFWDDKLKGCRLSAYAFRVPFVNVSTTPTECTYQTAKDDFYLDFWRTVFKKAPQHLANSFKSVQFVSAAKDGESFTETHLTFNFADPDEELLVKGFPSTDLIAFLRDGLQNLCVLKPELTGSCKLDIKAGGRNASFRLPATAESLENGPTSVIFPVYLFTPAPQIFAACDVFHDCNYMQQCVPASVGPRQPYPFECHCLPLYNVTGQLAHKQECYDPCIPNPCLFDGVCAATANMGYECKCTKEKRGQRCENDVCDTEMCSGNGLCSLTKEGDVKCECLALDSGNNCERYLLGTVTVAVFAFGSVFFLVWLLNYGYQRLFGKPKPRNWRQLMRPSKRKTKKKIQ